MNLTKSETQTISRIDTYKLAGAGAIVVLALAAFYLFSAHSLLVRVLGLLAAGAGAVVIALQTAPGAEILEFLQGSRAEVRKVVWPTRAETTQTTLIVIVMVVVMGLLLWLLDVLLLWLVRLITG
ncbi:MAG: preprotein translocase subunit SecE [Candidatus Competibacteraceae bacterium]|nr:preprotein translocase subunit SecE [Candidatus Competibacteraceae bacterium]